MAKQIINIGASPNDHTGDGLRTAFSKAKLNFDELYVHANSTSNPHNVTAAQIGALPISGGVLTGPLQLLMGSNTVSSLIFPAGALRTTPTANTVEWNGTDLFITQTGNVRKTIAYADVFGPDLGSGGTKGLVPAPASGDGTKFLRGDGTWVTVTGLANGVATFDNILVTGTVTAGTITHSGLILTSGTAIDQLLTLNISLTLTDQWQDTGINTNTLATGTYFVQMLVNNASVGGISVTEYYSGMMSWFSFDTDDTVEDEIILHRAGNKAGSNRVYLKTTRTLSANSQDLKLQISSLHNDSGSANIQFKFRRMI